MKSINEFTLWLSLSLVAVSFSSVIGQELTELNNNITEGELHISSSNTGGNIFTGLNVNQYLGADTFYNAGYNGSSATLANIEAHHPWSGHSVLAHVGTQVTGTGAAGGFGSHPSSVTHAMAGLPDPVQLGPLPYPANYFPHGIATGNAGATLVSGAIATNAPNNSGSFSLNNTSVCSTYNDLIQTGATAGPADVYNSSWGFSGAGSTTGFNTLAIGVDSMNDASGVVAVFSAGNSGASGTNTVGGIGAGYNSITVGALGADTDATPFDTRSGFSSHGPQDFADVTGPATATTIAGVRAAVDISAPGQNLTLAVLTDETNIPGSSPLSFGANSAGTSFAAPIVAGGAGLVVDAGTTLYGTAASIDGRVIKSVLQNSADKTAGWSNAQAPNAGVIETTQAMDFEVGTGRMNLDAAFNQYVNLANGGNAGTTDVAGTGQGDLGNVNKTGWDYGVVEIDGGGNDFNRYFIDSQIQAGSKINVTLNWFSDDSVSDSDTCADPTRDHLADLDVIIFQFDNLTDRNVIAEFARSISTYNVTEHLSVGVPNAGFYGIEVRGLTSHYNFTNQTTEVYGLAWSTVPEGSAFVLLLMVGLTSATARRIRRGFHRAA